MKNIPIGELLLQYGYINQAQLKHALEFQKDNKQARLGDILITLGFVTETQMLEALADRLKLEKVDIPTYPIDIEAVRMLPRFISLKYNVLPLAVQDGVLIIAINDPLNYYAIEDVKSIVNTPITIVLGEKSLILARADFYYSEIEAKKIANTVSESKDGVLAELNQNDGNAEESPIVKTVDSLLMKGYNANASDIHIEPFEEITKVRIRIDGVMIEYLTIHPSFHQSMVARIKIISGLDIAEKRIPQDGHFRRTIDGIVLNIRVSVIPSIHGEKVVLRFLTSNIIPDHMQTFGMNPANYQKFMRILDKPHGLIYITGPTGCGKTTTLYMVLEHLAKRPINISTIEDPVEKDLQRIIQMQVNIQAGLTFESGLRSLLRQDPDIIMVGETRDAQTAEISVKAAITGHLVVSTLHTNDALSTIVRLEDMGIEPYLIANSMVGVVAQRLLRKICPHCQEQYVPSKAEKEIIKQEVEFLSRGKGCHLCNDTGYKGRTAIHEVATIDNELRDLITSSAKMAAIYEYVNKGQGMKSLMESGIELVVQGVTTVSELLKL
ncbi:MAG: ATPase, T2SS/T4P/T4SS family [Clostridia bacterium]